MTDQERKAMEMALEALEAKGAEWVVLERKARIALRQALAQPEQKKESTPSNVDPRLLLGRSNNFTKETENRLCDIERRLAAIETQHAPPSKPAERNENG